MRTATLILDERTALADTSLLRGVPYLTLVAGLGKLLEPTGTIAAGGGADSAEDTFVLSHPVDILQHFLSHSWRDSAKLKWLSLLYHVNFTHAIVAGHLAATLTLAAIVTWPWLYPVEGFSSDTIDAKVINGPMSAVYGWVTVLMLLFGHLLFRPAQDMFLDKVCIHQTDPELKAAGIRALGAYLRRSEHMLVLWGDDYFDRLWCCYELALYIHMKGVDAVTILPIVQGAQVLLALAMISATLTYVAVCEVLGLDLTGVFSSLVFVLGSLGPFAVLAWYKGTVFSARQRLKAELQAFQIRDVSCFCCQVGHVLPHSGDRIPCDREFVESGIRAWFEKDGRDGLDAFNEVVRIEVSASVQKLLGKETVWPWPILMAFAGMLGWVAVGEAALADNPLWSRLYFLSDLPGGLAGLVSCDALSGLIMMLWHRCRLPGMRFAVAFAFFVSFSVASCPDLILQNGSISTSVKIAFLAGLLGLSMLLRSLAK